MKKAAITIAIILGINTVTFADPNGGGLFYRGAVPDEEYYESGYRINERPLLPFHELNTNQPATDTPLGSGVAILLCLGAGYALMKRNKE
jgi:hypothetical protein